MFNKWLLLLLLLLPLLLLLLNVQPLLLLIARQLPMLLPLLLLQANAIPFSYCTQLTLDILTRHRLLPALILLQHQLQHLLWPTFLLPGPAILTCRHRLRCVRM